MSIDTNRVYTLIHNNNKSAKHPFVTRDDKGKIIIPINIDKPGFIKITKIIAEREKYYIVEGERVLYDFYDDIQPQEFEKVLAYHGYRIGYKVPRTGGNGSYTTTNDYYSLAYNLETGVIITFDTVFDVTDVGNIYAYLPNIGGMSALGNLHPWTYMTSAHLTTIMFQTEETVCILHDITKMMQDVSKYWTPSTWSSVFGCIEQCYKYEDFLGEQQKKELFSLISK